MSKEIWNADALVSVKVTDFQEVILLTFRPYQKGSWWTNEQLEGYESYTGTFYTKDELLKNGYRGDSLEIRDKVVYSLPFITMNFANGKKAQKEFATYQEACDYGNMIVNMAIGDGKKIEL